MYMSWKELEKKVCGTVIVDIEFLKKNTDYEISKEDNNVKWLWKALESFNNEQRIMYLKFVWGRSRLPLSSDGFDRRHKINRLFIYKDIIAIILTFHFLYHILASSLLIFRNIQPTRYYIKSCFMLFSSAMKLMEITHHHLRWRTYS